MYSLDTCALWYILLHVSKYMPTQVRADSTPPTHNDCMLKLDPHSLIPQNIPSDLTNATPWSARLGKPYIPPLLFGPTIS